MSASPQAPAKASFTFPFWAQIVAGLALGVLFGWIARSQDISWLATTLEKTGDLFVQLLKLAIAPLVFFAILVSITNLRKVNNAARLASRTLLWFMITSLIAVGIGIAIGLLTDPGAGTGLTAADGKEPKKTGSWIDFLTGIVPTDIVTPFTELKVLQIVFLAVVAGIAALQLGAKAKPVLDLAESALELLQKALWWVIRLAPIGTIGLIGTAIATYGWDLIGKYATFTADVYIAAPGDVRRLPAAARDGRQGQPGPVLQGRLARHPAGLRLPLLRRHHAGHPEGHRAPRRPEGVRLLRRPVRRHHQDGRCAAIYPALAAIFIAQIFDVQLGIKEYLLIVFVSVIGSAATAGLTGATVMLTLTLSTLGLPLAGVGLLLAIDPILDMMRTATNVAGQALVPVIVSAREGILDKEAYANASASPLDEDARTPEPVAVAA